jgi:hypothetical protein
MIRSSFNRLRDNRGAIMVLGVFFACMMIGWMWMLVGLGDAMIWRDRSQEAADATTYSSAAIQAQAMNLISFINILMLIMAALYLLLSFVYNILDLFHVLLGSVTDSCGPLPSSADARADEIKALEAVPYIGEVAAIVGNAWSPAARGIQLLHDGLQNGAPSPMSVGGLLGSYESAMIDALPPMSDFEDLVSYAAPWAGTVMGAYTATTFTDYGKSRLGLALSSSLVPATLTPGQAGSGLPVKKWEACGNDECTKPQTCDVTQAEGSSCTQYSGGDKREGLPVQIPNAGFTALCSFIGAKISSTIVDALNAMGLPSFVGWIVGKVIGVMANKISSSYCQSNSRGLFNPVDNTISSIARPITLGFLGGLKNNETCPQNNWGHGKSGAKGGPKPCNYVYEMKLGNGNQFWQDPQFAGGPHLVVDYAMNGNDWMQVWGAVWGGNLYSDLSDPSTAYQISHAEKLVATAGMDSKAGGGIWSQTIPQMSATQFNLYLSQSEFYFDCNNYWTNNACNNNSNASYSIGWRARLRRMHGVSWGSDLLGYMYNGSLGPSSGLASEFKRIVSQSFTNKLVGKAAATLGNAGLQYLIGKGQNVVGGAVNPASYVPDFIH